MKKITLGEIAKQLGLKHTGDPAVEISSVGTIASAKKGAICFLMEKQYQSYLKTTEASAVILREAHSQLTTLPCLITENPKLVFAQVIHLLHPAKPVSPGVHSTVVTGQGVEIHPEATIGAYCVLGDGVKVGPRAHIETGCTLADGVTIGDETHLFPRVSVYTDVKIGKHCVIHSGTVIGSDGFGFANDKGKWIKVPQIGSVIIGDHVEIGANTTIDRGAVEDTIISDGCILDNLIQVGHNVKIGSGTAIAACVAIAGSATIGRYCLVGGGSIINGHLTIVDGVHLAGNSQVANDIKQSGAYGSAITARDMGTWKRNLARFHHLDELSRRVKRLEQNQAGKPEL